MTFGIKKYKKKWTDDSDDIPNQPTYHSKVYSKRIKSMQQTRQKYAANEAH